MEAPTPFLMYHEIVAPGGRPARTDPGYVRYVISDATFRAHVAAIRSAGARGIAVGDFPGSGTHRDVVITFDDGCASDLEIAAPELLAAGFRATFYVTVAFLDKPGFMSTAQVAELTRLGFEIGSHSMTHAYVADLDDSALFAELHDSREHLRDVIGADVAHFSCPGGRWSERVANVAREVGYRTVTDSRPVANAPATDSFRLGRFAVTEATNAALIGRIAEHGTMPVSRVRETVLGAAKRVLGNRLYDRARRAILERGVE